MQSQHIKGEIEVKRFYLKGLDFAAACPDCDDECVFDDTQYMSYPEIGELDSLPVFCVKCDDHFLVPARLVVLVDVFPEDAFSERRG
jgi:hypothetical protein